MSFAIARIALALLTLVALPEASVHVSTFSYGGAPIKEYAYLAGKQVAMYTASGGAATSYHLDPAGSPLAATNSTGALLWREAYRPYGERLKVQDGGTNTLWFAGKVQDLTTGLSYLGARHYDPAIGRFMAVDPVGFTDQSLHSFNRYAYANNNPYKFVDPDGRAADLIVDLGFIGYGVYKLAAEPSWVNAAALGGDVLGAVVPFVTGVGSGIRAAAHADDAGDMLRGADAAGNAARGANALPALDRTGKVHGALPKAEDLGRYSRDELKQLQKDLQQSVQERIRRTSELGPDRAHGQRQGAEQQLIKQIEKVLGGS